MGYMAAVGGCIYGLLHAFWLRHKVLTDPNQQPDAEQPGKNYLKYFVQIICYFHKEECLIYFGCRLQNSSSSQQWG